MFLRLLFQGNAEAIDYFKNAQHFFGLFFPKAFGNKRHNRVEKESFFPKPLLEIFRRLCVQCAHTKLAMGLWCLSIDSIESALNSRLSQVRQIFPEFTINRITTLALVASLKDEMAVKGDLIYSSDLYVVKFGHLSKACEVLLCRFGKGIHFKELVKHLNEIRKPNKKISARNVHGLLARVDWAFLIERGTFMHINNVPNPKMLLFSIENDITKHLKASSHPFVSVGKFYNENEEELEDSGVVSEVMLYFSLKRFSEKLIFAKCPYIYLKENFEGRVLLTDYIESYFYESGKPIDYKQLELELLDETGMKQYQFDQIRLRVPQIVKVGPTEYSHVNHLEYDFEKLEQLVEFAHKLVLAQGYVSVEKIFGEKIILCKSAGITNSHYLFYIMRYHYLTDTLQIPFKIIDYPHLSLPDDSENESFSIRDQLIRFVKCYDSPCPSAEILLNFQKRRGIKENTLYNTFYQIPSLVRYDSSSYVHLDTIGWNNIIEEKLEEIAIECFERERKIGNAFGRISLLIEEVDYKLPLERDCAWTNCLLYELLKRNKNFIILGTAREAFVPRENNLHIKATSDLVLHFLKTRFNGSASLFELERFLQEQKIIQKRIPKEILDSTDSTVVKNSQIFLKELFVCLV